MINTPYRVSTYVLYQLTLLVGIVMMPVALLARRLGLRLPIRNLIEATGRAYENASAR
ncbi:MAG: hypothetical protein ABEJ74_03275 [Haloferacaceae archaeon]